MIRHFQVNNFGFGHNFTRKIVCYVAFIVVYIAFVAYIIAVFLDQNKNLLFLQKRYSPISILIHVITHLVFPLVREIIIFIYVILLCNANERYKTINKCLK